MSVSNERTLTCPKCKKKVKVIVEPFPDEVVCPTCNHKLKLVKIPVMFAYPTNPASPRKEIYRYELRLNEDKHI